METIIAYILKDTLHIRTQRNYHMISSCEEKKKRKKARKEESICKNKLKMAGGNS